MIMGELVPVILLLTISGQALHVIKAVEKIEGEDYCLADDTDPYILCSSKTPYVFARGENLSPRELVPKECKARKVWLLSRHGTRYPGDDNILAFQLRLPHLQDQIIQAHQDGKGSLCAGDIEAVSTWHLGAINITWDKILAPEGERELKNLALSYKALLPELLNHPFDNGTYQFRHTKRQRTERSARSFAIGLFGVEEGETIYMPEPIDKDPLLKFYENCPRYDVEVGDNPEAVVEYTLFKDGPEMLGVVASASSRLGFHISLEDVEVTYNACRFYKAWAPSLTSAWCAAFTPDDLKILEYWQDLKYYYEDGYGHEINYKIACPLVKDLIQHFRSVFEDGDTTKGVFYFSHSEALIKLMTRIGLRHDETPLTHNSIDPDRLWRSSIHSPFGTNVAFILSSCSDGGWWVSLSENEIATAIPGCSGGTRGCSWEEFLQVLGPFEDCPFEEMCKLQGCASSWQSVSCTVDTILRSLKYLFASLNNRG